MKIIKKIFGIFFSFVFALSLYMTLTDKQNVIINIIMTLIVGTIAYMLLIRKPDKSVSNEEQQTSNKRSCCTNPPINDLSQNIKLIEDTNPQELTNIESSDLYIETHNMIYRVDGKPITDEEVPYLIQAGYEKAIEQEKVNPNVKFHRTKREEDLCVQFMINHGNEIQKHTDSFEDLCRLAYAENDLNEKIKLLHKTITVYEKERKWFYRSKGGTIYFQDYYEHQHNSKNNDFSYIDSVKDFLNYNLYKRDYIIPEIMQTITSSGGIIQKDIYEHFPDISKSVMQLTIRELENANLIVRTKKGNSYFLSLSN